MCVVHCETSSGVMNEVEKIGELVRKHQPKASFFVDAMSSFGAVPLDLKNVDFVVSSANKCLQVFCHITRLVMCRLGIKLSFC